MNAVLPRVLLAPALASTLLAPAVGASAQGTPAISAADTVQAVNPDFPREPGGERAPGEQNASGEATTPQVVSELDVLRGKVAALETRVARLEELLRGTRAPGGETQPMSPAAGEGEMLAVPSEAEVEENREERSDAQDEQRETAREFDQLQEEQRDEVQQRIRDRINNSRLNDGN